MGFAQLRSWTGNFVSIAVGNDGVTCLEAETKASGIHAKLEMFDLFFVIAV